MTNKTRPTPETDAATHEDWSGGAAAVDLETCKRLERERDELREAIKVSDGAIDDAISLIERCSIDETPGDFHETLTAIQAVREVLKPFLP